ncbi:MAG: alpha/beta fold hydrolase [Pseudomonadota bacterium]
MRRWLLAAWLVALVASNAWRLTHPPETVAGDDQALVDVATRVGAAQLDAITRIPYRDYGDPAAAQPPVLLVHGTPVASRAMSGLARGLSADFRVIAPDLPGFGSAAEAIPDYSSITHGRYLLDLMDALAIDRAHLVVYSQGGAAGITLTDLAPERVVSLTLVSAIGLQEYELFGSYRGNHIVYDGQHAVFAALRWLTPHFGYFDNAILGRGYTRNLQDTDQRVIEPMLRRLQPPVHIVHGRDDGLVPLAAAQAHWRLVPQSELTLIEGGHEPAYADPDRVTEVVLPFLDRVTRGDTASRTTADPDRVQQANGAMPALERSRLAGAALIVLLLALVVATYISEDLTCITAGLLVAQGIVGFVPATLACLVGIFTSDLALFAAGRWLGRPALARMVSPDRMRMASSWLRDRGPLVILASRFLPGTRLPTYTAAGALHMPWLRFAGYFAAATVLWTPLLVGAAAAWGEVAQRAFERYAAFGVWLIVGGAIVLWLLVHYGLPALTHSGRRQLVGRWRRIRNFEFWPRWAFYPPVVLDGILQALRYRSVSLFTLANPGMPLGGLVGESKSEILEQLESSGNVVPFARVPTGDRARRLDTVAGFAAREGWPVVIKPDLGERGKDVGFVNSALEAGEYLDAHAGPLIVQRKATGIEFGVFYIREPDAETGTVFSITRKGQTTVTGDGRRRLSDLILDDERAVCMAPYFLREHASRLDEVPGAGERVVLNAIGTHSRGSLFTDAGVLGTPELTAEIDRISKHFEGFYLGRYDLMVDNDEALSGGHDVRIIELNGVSSEATHIYDPALSVWNAWRVTLSQWRIAWRIGAAVRAQGTPPPGPRALLRALFG